MNVTETFKRLSTYELRLSRAKQYPNPSAQQIQEIEFYERQIEEMNAEIAVADLIYEMDLNAKKPSVCITDCGTTVSELFKTTRVVSIDAVWSWKHFKSMFKVEFYFKKEF